MFKSLSMLSFFLSFTGLTLVSLSLVNAHDRAVIAASFFKTNPHQLSLLD